MDKMEFEVRQLMLLYWQTENESLKDAIVETIYKIMTKEVKEK